MPLRTRAFVALLSAAALGLPAGGAAAGCTATPPLDDKRLAHLSCTGVHTGMGLIVPSKKYGEMQCTAGFVFADQFGNKYLTVPGTCHLDYQCLEDAIVGELPPPLNELRLPVCLLPEDSEEEPYHKRGGPVVTDLDGKRVGVLVYAVNKEGINFALIRVDRGVKVDHAMPMYGGPVRSGVAGLGAEAYSVSGPSWGATPNARTGVMVVSGSLTTHKTEAFTALATGSPVMLPDGAAIGYYTGWYSIPLGWIVSPYGPGLDRAGRRTKLKLRLLTAKLNP